VAQILCVDARRSEQQVRKNDAQKDRVSKAHIFTFVGTRAPKIPISADSRRQ
jgi:hypothetical protein